MVHTVLVGSMYKNIFSIIKRQIEERSDTKVVCEGYADFTIELSVNAELDSESFVISEMENGVRISGNDNLALLFGVGEFLHCSSFKNSYFCPTDKRGEFKPVKKIRGMYFATHFNNFYHVAPIQKVLEYVEDIALWGINTIAVWFDMHHYQSMDDDGAIKMVKRLKEILLYAKKLGLKTMFTTIANEAFANSPKEIRAEWHAQNGYFGGIFAHYNIEICPSTPEGLSYIRQVRSEMLEKFSETSPDYLMAWPYDQGGCTCSKCAPWGGNGYLKAYHEWYKAVHSHFPNAKIILSTWYFDRFTQGEWEAFAGKAEEYKDTADYLLVDYIGGGYPKYVLDNGAPASLPVIGFPEISMHGAKPWGGFGTNVFPDLLNRLWEKSSDIQQGGFPYSEGIFDDMNKAMYASLYWNGGGDTKEYLKKYVSYEFGAEHAEEILKALLMMEQTLKRKTIYKKTKDELIREFIIENTQSVDEIYDIISRVDKQMDVKLKNLWRYRLVYLRAVIDKELKDNNGLPNQSTDACFYELEKIYNAQEGDYIVSPPTGDKFMEFADVDNTFLKWEKEHNTPNVVV